jgi:cyclic lactone autoinducer peptide
MKKICSPCLKLLSKAVAAVSLFMVSVSMGTMSSFGLYESEMPEALKSTDGEERD